MSETFTEALQLQCDIMLKLARRLDEKGYAVVVYNLNSDAKNERYLYRYFTGAIAMFVRDWGNAHPKKSGRYSARRPVIVDVCPREWVGPVRQGFDVVRRSGKVFDYPFTFRCSIPRRVQYREIHAALGTVSNKMDRRYGPADIDRLNSCIRSDNLEYSGSTRDQLEILLRVLDMPQHRKLLLGQ